MLRARVPEVESERCSGPCCSPPWPVSAAVVRATLRVTKVAVSTQKPSNLALYLDVRDNGRPVPGLQEKDFRVYEDGKLMPPKKGKRALLDADVVSANFAIVQVDLSGPIADSEYLPELAETVAHFAQDLNDRQEVAVNAFDGNDEVAPFLGFGAGQGTVPQARRRAAASSARATATRTCTAPSTRGSRRWKRSSPARR